MIELFGMLLAQSTAVPAATEPQFDYPVMAAEWRPPSARSSRKQLGRPRHLFEINENQYPIDGAGKLKFSPSTDQIDFTEFRSGVGAVVNLRLWFDGNGSPANCDYTTGHNGWVGSQFDWMKETLVPGLCEQFQKRARFEYAAWQTQSIKRGFLEREFTLTRKMRPSLPVVFTSKDDGLPVELTVKEIDKEVTCLIDSQRMDSKAREAVCNSFMKTDEYAEILEFPRRGGRPLEVDLMAYVKGTLANKAKIVMRQPLPDYGLGQRFEEQIDAGQRLDMSLGAFESNIQPSHVPFLHRVDLRARVTAVLGIDAAGRVKTCRPQRSDSYPVIENLTCRALYRRGRFKFAAKQTWSGLRYMVATVAWNSMR